MLVCVEGERGYYYYFFSCRGGRERQKEGSVLIGLSPANVWYTLVPGIYMCVLLCDTTVLHLRRRLLSYGVFTGTLKAGGKGITCPIR